MLILTLNFIKPSNL